MDKAKIAPGSAPRSGSETPTRHEALFRTASSDHWQVGIVSATSATWNIAAMQEVWRSGRGPRGMRAVKPTRMNIKFSGRARMDGRRLWADSEVLDHADDVELVENVGTHENHVGTHEK